MDTSSLVQIALSTILWTLLKVHSQNRRPAQQKCHKQHQIPVG